jgi:hypothetical protein
MRGKYFDEKSVSEKVCYGVEGRSGQRAFTKANAQSVESDTQAESGSVLSGLYDSAHD